MNPWFLQQVSNEEKENILSKHKELYNGYQTMQPKVSNEQPLYVQDFAKDKLGATLTNDGKLVGYTNKIYEQFDQHMTEEKTMCSECGSEMREGECSECGYRMEEIDENQIVVKGICDNCGGFLEGGECPECGHKLEGEMEEETDTKERKKSRFEKWMESDEDTKLERALKKFGDFLMDLEDEIDGRKKEKEETNEGIFDIPDIKKVFKKREVKDRRPYEPEAIEKIIRLIQDARNEQHLDSAMRMFRTLEDMNPEMHEIYKMRVLNAFKRRADELDYYLKKKNIGEGKGKLSDIYSVKDLDLKGEFDYVEGGDNYDNSFEKDHHMKKIMSKENATSNAPMGKHYDEIEEPYNFKSGGPVGDGGTLRQKPISSIKSAAIGLKEGGFTGGGNAPDMDLSNVDPAFNFDSEGPVDDTFTIPADDMDLDEKDVKKPYKFVSGGGNENGGDVYPVYEDMSSAWDEELEEVDISGAQASQTSAKKPYAFVSTGPGKAGPYQTHSWGGEQLGGYEGENEDAYWDLEPNELDPDKIDREASWEDITSMTGEDEFSNLSEDVVEDFVIQKKKINEMMERMKKFN